MKKVFTTGLLLLCFFVDSYSQTKTFWSPEQMLQLKNITAVRVSPDGKQVLYAVRQALMTEDKSEFINHIFLSSISGSNAIELTKGEKNSSNPKWSPDGSRIAFQSNREGKNNLYIIDPSGGEAEKITDAQTNISDFEWAPDGHSIAYIQVDGGSVIEEKNTKAKNDWYFVDENYKQNRLFVISLIKNDSTGKKAVQLITKENYNVISFNWSPDSKFIVFSHGKSSLANASNYSDISIADISSSETKLFLSTAANEAAPKFSNDGKWIAYICSENPVIWSGKNLVKIISVNGGEQKTLAETPNADISGIIGWSLDNKDVWVTDADKTLARIYKLNIDTKGIIDWNKDAADFISVIDYNSKSGYLGFLLQNAQTPAEAFISKAEQYHPSKISSINSAIISSSIPHTEIIRWKSVDGKEMEGLITYPLNYSSNKKYPFILNVHGGPAGVFSQTFIASNSAAYPLAAWAEMGYVVLRSNPRGSSGYGNDFRRANERDWGGADYQDLMSGVDAVIAKGIIDTTRMGVAGWSYGGFMSSWIVGHTNRFKVASIGAPVVDLVGQDGTSDIPGFLPSYYHKYFWEDYDVYLKHSPLYYVGNVQTPVLLEQGEADIRVPFSQGMEFYQALKRRGVPVRFLVLPRQPHGPTEPRMILKVQQTNVEWMKKYLN